MNQTVITFADLTERDRDLVERVVALKSHKRISRELNIPLGTIKVRVKHIAAQLPGGGRPQVRIITWFWMHNAGSTGQD